MPLRINEIGVYVAIGDTVAVAPPPGREREGMTPEAIEALVRACVRDALRSLRMQEDR